MRLDIGAMLTAADASPNSPEISLSSNANANTDIKLDISELDIAESVAQELDYWEKLVFSFDMDRDPSGSSQPDTTRGRGKRREEQQTQQHLGGPPPLGSGQQQQRSSSSQSHGRQQTIDPRHLPPPAQLASQPPIMPGQLSNPQLAQLRQLPSLDPYMLAHLAALSAIQNQNSGQPVPPGAQQPHVNPSDPYAVLRHVQGLLYPYGSAPPGHAGQHPGSAQGLPQAQPQPGPSRHPSRGPAQPPLQQRSVSESSGNQWAFQQQQQPGIGSAQFPFPPLDPSLAGHLSQYPTFMLPNAYQQPTQTPEAGPSNESSRARSRSTTSASSSITPISPTSSRGAQGLVDEGAISEDKRRRNTAASARFRIKKKHKVLALERSVVELEDRAEDLEREASELRRENGWLREMLIMKGRTARTQASAIRAELEAEEDEDEEGEEGVEEGEEEDERMEEEEREDTSGKTGKGKARAS